MKNKLAYFLIVLSVMLIGSTLLLALLSVLLWKLDGTLALLCGGVTAVYVIVNLAGGFFVGKSMGQQKFFWGLLTGAAYFLVLFVIGVCVMHTELSGNTQLISGALICVISAMAGGMLAPMKNVTKV